MSCKDIIPQVTIDGITIEESGGKVSDATISFSPDADELFVLSVSHTNLVQIDSTEEGFSLEDLLDAATGSPNLYNIKVLVTDSPEKYDLILDAIKLSEQVSSYLYGSPDVATPALGATAAAAAAAATAASNASAEEIKNAANGGLGTDTPSDMKNTIDNLNACAFKATTKKAEEQKKAEEAAKAEAAKKAAAEAKAKAAKKAGGLGFGSFSMPSFLFQKPETLRDRVIDALNDNTIHLDARRDGIASMTVSIEVTQKEITLKGVPPVPNFMNSQEIKMMFATTQLKDLYMCLVPNVEYREDKQLIFTVRDYKSLTLVKNFQPQLFGGTAGVVPLPDAATPINQPRPSLVSAMVALPNEAESVALLSDFVPELFTEMVDQKKVVVSFLKDEPKLDLAALFIDLLNKQLENIYGEKALDTFKQNKKQEPFVSPPVVSLGYNEEINGCFFLNQRTLAKNLTAFEALLEQPQLYKQILQGVIIKKVYDDGTETELPPPVPLQGLSFKENMIRGYAFSDKYDVRNFKYVVEVTAKNPVEYLLQYVMPKLSFGKAALDALIGNITIADKTDNVVILNPVSGFFTDDYLASDLYKTQSLSYNAARKLLFVLYNFLLVDDPMTHSPVPLVKTKQLFDLQEMYVGVVNTLQNLAKAEQINIQDLSSFSSKKKGISNRNPYKTLSLRFGKPYAAPSTSVFVDFLYAEKPARRSGFEINPDDLLTRISTEGTLLNSFGESPTTNEPTPTEPLSITPVSIIIDDVGVDLIEDPAKLEEVATKVLLSAELEVKDPKTEFTNEGNVLAKLLAADGVRLVNTADKTLKVSEEKESFAPTQLTRSRPVIRAKKWTMLNTALKGIFDALNDMAMKELGGQTAKALYLSEADYNIWVLHGQSALKTGFMGGPKIDVKHGIIAIKLGETGYKDNPATYMTRLMNSYQLEYLSGFDKNFIPVYSPLTKDVISEAATGTATVARLTLKAGIPIRKEYTILHSYFLISDGVQPLQVSPIFTFLPTIFPLPFMLPPVTLNIPIGPITVAPALPGAAPTAPTTPAAGFGGGFGGGGY